jgi:hypothetical protein
VNDYGLNANRVHQRNILRKGSGRICIRSARESVSAIFDHDSLASKLLDIRKSLD